MQIITDSKAIKKKLIVFLIFFVFLCQLKFVPLYGSVSN